MSIILNQAQLKAVNIGVERYKNKEKYTTIAGYAGTGKSTVVKFMVDALGLKSKDIKYVAFTGKAAQVLRSKGHNATTIHKLIYKSYLNPRTGKFVYSLVPKSEVRAKVIIVDEVSMVPDNILRDLASFNIHLILLGDPGQLPPVGADNGMLDNPHIFLEDVMRQALDNSIIKLSMLIREGKPIPRMDDEFVKVINKNELHMGMINWADQVICGKNATRKYINNQARLAKGFSDPLPQVGDKMICLRNDWEVLNGEEMPIVNGTIGIINKIHKLGDFHITQPTIKNGFGIVADFTPDFTSTFTELNLDPNIPLGFDSVIQQQINAKVKSPESVYQELDYGYAITCHKSQGSEFDKVLVIEERLRGDQHRKWLYTAVTRAKEKLVLVLDN